MDHSGSASQQLSTEGTLQSTSADPTPPGVPRTIKKRTPLTNVACQECRKRKTKCDGQRPRCGNCARRNVRECYYELDIGQASRVAGYKSKIEQQELRIEELEKELHRLYVEFGTQSPTPVQASVLNNVRGSSDRVTASAQSSEAPLPETQEEVNARYHAQEQEIIAFARAQALERERFDREGLLMDQQRSLHRENLRLKELLLLLTLMEDRTLAQRMALQIQEEGVSDDLLSQAQGLYAALPYNHVQPNRTTSGTPSLPAFRSLDLPQPATPSHQSELDPKLHGHENSYPRMSGMSDKR